MHSAKITKFSNFSTIIHTNDALAESQFRDVKVEKPDSTNPFVLTNPVTQPLVYTNRLMINGNEVVIDNLPFEYGGVIGLTLAPEISVERILTNSPCITGLEQYTDTTTYISEFCSVDLTSPCVCAVLCPDKIVIVEDTNTLVVKTIFPRWSEDLHIRKVCPAPGGIVVVDDKRTAYFLSESGDDVEKEVDCSWQLNPHCTEVVEFGTMQVEDTNGNNRVVIGVVYTTDVGGYDSSDYDYTGHMNLVLWDIRQDERPDVKVTYGGVISVDCLNKM